MKYCTNCGNELKENSNFCTNCGKPTKKELEKIKKIEKEKKEQANEKLLLWLGTFLVIISSIISKYLGEGAKLSKATPNQIEQLTMIELEVKDVE